MTTLLMYNHTTTCQLSTTWKGQASDICRALLNVDPSLGLLQANRQIREDKKKQEWELDQEYMKQQAEVLEKQEKTRQDLLDKLKAVQVGR